MANVFDFQPSGELGLYVREFDVAARVVLKALIFKGAEVITRDELMDTLGAVTAAEKNSILWAVRKAKDDGWLDGPTKRGVWNVITSREEIVNQTN